MGRAARIPDTTFWVEPGDVEQARVTLGPEESHHLAHVFRAAPGTPFEATDGRGSLYRCAVVSATGRRVVGRVEEVIRDAGELPFAIHLLVGLPAAPQAEAIVEHAVPLGASSIDFVAAERSGRPPLERGRLERLERVARAGVKQSRRTRLPEIRSSGSLAQALSGQPAGTLRWFAEPDGEPPGQGRLSGQAGAPLVLAVGPPGSFSASEKEALVAERFEAIALGPSRLTTASATLCLMICARNALLSSLLRPI